MGGSWKVSRRQFVQTGSLALGATMVNPAWGKTAVSTLPTPLTEFGYGSVTITSARHEAQRQHTLDILMNVSEDSLLMPLRQMAGQPAPGEDLGGWYHYDPNWDFRKDEPGFAPGHLFGQWVSALARNYAITGDPAIRDKVLRINALYAKTISPDFYTKNRFPAYCYDKIVCGLIDSHSFANDPDAFAILDQTTDVAAPLLPGRALDRDRQDKWRASPDDSWRWDESYTVPENQFLAYQRGAGNRYRDQAIAYLDDDTYFKPLARGEDVLGGKHAYSYVNTLSSGMQAYMVGGSEMHLRAVQNAFVLLQEQSFATGGWGPDEQLRKRNSGDIYASLQDTHHSFETPCGSYAHFKVTRYLLRVTGDARYGDSMERVMYNTVLGAKKLERDGHAFYYSDYNFNGKRFYHDDRWPCCAGTLPQVAADYRINTYFRGPNAVYVNLYIPSTLSWTEGNTQLSLTQAGNYPLSPEIGFDLTASQPVETTLHFRIPEWAHGASMRVNGTRVVTALVPGTFAAVRRTWKNGDRIELDLPLAVRVEAVDAEHADTVALLRGPLVLFAVTETVPAVTRRQLLAAKQIGAHDWQIETADGAVTMTPFTELRERAYTTYLKTT
jgi:DUF1680 family protein